MGPLLVHPLATLTLLLLLVPPLKLQLLQLRLLLQLLQLLLQLLQPLLFVFKLPAPVARAGPVPARPR